MQLLVRKDVDLDDKVGDSNNSTISINGLPSNVEYNAYQVGYVYTRRSPRYQGSGGGWRPDPLLPLSAPIVVLPGVTQSIWLSFHVLAGASPGNYTGTVTLDCAVKCGKKGIVIPFAVRIFNVKLPELQNSEIGTAWSGSWDAETFAPYYQNLSWSNQKYDWFQMMMDHRMPPDSIYLKEPRPLDDYEWLAKNGAKWFALLDVSSLPDPQSPHIFPGLLQKFHAAICG